MVSIVGDFDALQPRLSRLSDSVSGRAQKFLARMFAWLISGIEGGEEEATEFNNAIERSWAFFEKFGSENEEDEFDNAMDNYITASRAVMQLLNPMSTKFLSDLEHVIAKPSKRNSTKSKPAVDENFAGIAAAIRKNPHYSQALEWLERNKNLLKERAPAIVKALQCLGAETAIVTKIDLISDAVDKFARLTADVTDTYCTQSSFSFEGELRLAAVNCFDNIEGVIGSIPTLSGRRSTAEKMVDLVKACKQAFPADLPTWHDFNMKLSGVLDDLQNEAAGKMLKEELDFIGASTNSDITGEKLLEMEAKISDFLCQFPKEDVRVYTYQEKVDQIIEKLNAITGESGAEYIDALGRVLRALCKTTATEHKTTKALVALIASWPRLLEAIKSWEALGGTIEEKIAASPDRRHIKVLLQTCAAIKELIANVNSQSQEPFQQSFDLATRYTCEAGKYYVDHDKSDMTTHTEYLNVWCNGKENGEWWEGYELSDITLEQLDVAAEGTLMQLDGTELSHHIDSLQKKLALYLDTLAMFNTVPDDADKKETVELLNRSRATKMTSLLWVLVKPTLSGALLNTKEKRTVKKIAEETVTLGVVPNLPPSLWNKVRSLVPNMRR